MKIDRERLPHRSLATIQAIQETKDSRQVSRLARHQEFCLTGAVLVGLGLAAWCSVLRYL